MHITRYLNQEKLEGPLPPLSIENPGVLEVFSSLAPTGLSPVQTSSPDHSQANTLTSTQETG